MSDLAAGFLADCRILLAEDEYMIADEIASVLTEAGAVVVGPVASVGDALDLLTTQDRLDGALLDLNLLGQLAWPVVDALLARRVPVVISTGYDTTAIPAAYISLPRCEKPTTGRDILKVIGRALRPNHP